MKLTCLLYEDREEVIESISSYIKNSGDIKLVVCSSEEAFPAVLYKERPSMFVIDTSLMNDKGKMSGFNVALLLRRTERYKYSEIIIISMKYDIEIMTLNKLNCFRFFNFPCNSALIKSAIRDAVDKYMAQGKYRDIVIESRVLCHNGEVSIINIREVIWYEVHSRLCFIHLTDNRVRECYRKEIPFKKNDIDECFILVNRCDYINVIYFDSFSERNSSLRLRNSNEKFYMTASGEERLRKYLGLQLKL